MDRDGRSDHLARKKIQSILFVQFRGFCAILRLLSCRCFVTFTGSGTEFLPVSHRVSRYTSAVRRLTAVVLLASLSGGCLVISLQPAYDDESVVFEERLVGQWENVEDRTAAAIERAEWRSYRVVFTDRATTLTFQSNATRIGGALFLDLTQARGVDAGPYLVPTHGIYRVELAGDTLSAAALDYEWFTQAMALRKVGRLAAALDSRRNIAIGASTTELRAWLARAPDEAFGAAMTFTRKR